MPARHGYATHSARLSVALTLNGLPFLVVFHEHNAARKTDRNDAA